MAVMSKEIQGLVAAKFAVRAQAQYLKPKSAAYKKAELEFAMGAVAALDALAEVEAGKVPDGSSIPPAWFIAAIRGEQILKVAA